MKKEKKKRDVALSPAGPAGDYEIYHIKVLDGIRAVSIALVAWYHFWQQSWLAPAIGDFSLDWLVRNGCILVDMMILLSGFCLFLPHARAMVYGQNVDSAGQFYRKRIARILPSYYISLLLVLVLFALPSGEYAGDTGFFWKDFLSHLTFTNNLSAEVMHGTHLNGVLWTLAVEAQLYLLFPLLAKWFRRHPVVTYGGMLAVGLISSYGIGTHFEQIDQGLYVNSTLTFFSVYANGMMGAWLYMLYTKKRKKRTVTEGVVATVAAVVCIAVFRQFCLWRLNSDSETRWQVDHRFLLSLLFLAFLFGVMLAGKWVRKLWDNRAMVFLAGISFNFYICHQYLAVKLKELRVPDWTGEELPNMTGDLAWQWKYTILCVVLSLAIAVAMTYLVEKPLARILKQDLRKDKRHDKGFVS